jgi:hypothetical protein
MRTKIPVALAKAKGGNDTSVVEAMGEGEKFGSTGCHEPTRSISQVDEDERQVTSLSPHPTW